MLSAFEHIIEQGTWTLGFLAHGLGGVVKAGIPFTSLFSERMGASASVIRVLFEDENLLATLSEKICASTSSAAAANNNCVKFGRGKFWTEGAGTDGADPADLLPRPVNVDEESRDGQDYGESQECPNTK